MDTRKEIFTIHFKKSPVSDDVSIDELSTKTKGYSGAEVIKRDWLLHTAVLKTRQNHCLSAGRVTFVTCPPWQKSCPPTHWFYNKNPCNLWKVTRQQDGLGVLSARPHHFVPGIGRADGLYFQHWSHTANCKYPWLLTNTQRIWTKNC